MYILIRTRLLYHNKKRAQGYILVINDILNKKSPQSTEVEYETRSKESLLSLKKINLNIS